MRCFRQSKRIDCSTGRQLVSTGKNLLLEGTFDNLARGSRLLSAGHLLGSLEFSDRLSRSRPPTGQTSVAKVWWCCSLLKKSRHQYGHAMHDRGNLLPPGSEALSYITPEMISIMHLLPFSPTMTHNCPGSILKDMFCSAGRCESG